jgi:SAM-dependent methyltransferase
MNDRKQRVIDFYNQEAAGYIDQYRLPPFDQEFYPANEIRLEIIVSRLKERGVTHVLDIGCGSAGPLVRFLREGWDARGFDFAPEMVRAAREVLAREGLDPERVRVGDLERLETLPSERFDAVIATGVFPHNLDDPVAYRNLRILLKPGGVAFVEYRNALMALFSLNQYSESFFWHDLLRADALPADLREATRAMLAQKFDTPVASVGRPRAIEFTDILARFHNPLTLESQLSEHGLGLRRVHYYHFHCAPPALERTHTRAFRQASLGMERPDDWRGMFLASAFVAEIEAATATP